MENEKPGCCDSCEFETSELIAYPVRRNFPKESEPKWLCDLCASTAAGSAHEYPEQYGESAQVLKTICYVGNAVLAAIASARSGETKHG